MLEDQSSVICLNDKYLYEQNRIVEIEPRKVKKARIPFYRIIKFLTIFEEENIYSKMITIIKDRIENIIDNEMIEPESIDLFLKLVQEEKVEINSVHYWDLYKLSEIFRVKSLEIELERYAKEHSEDLDFIIRLFNEREKRTKKTSEKIQQLIDKCSINIEEILQQKFNECLKNDNFSNLPISTIYRIIEGSDKEKIDHDLLLEFINQSIEERCPLFTFIKLSKLSDDKFKSLYDDFIKSKQKEIHYSCLNNDIEYIYKLKTSKENGDPQIELQNQKYQKQIEELTSKIHEQEDIIKDLSRGKEQKAEEIIQILFKYREGIERCISDGIYHNLKNQFYIMHAN